MLELISTIVTVFSSLLLGSIVAKKSKGNATKILFAILTLDIAAWAIASYISLINYELLWARVVLFLAAAQVGIFFIFVNTFPKKKIGLSRAALGAFLLLVLSSMFLSLTPIVFEDIEVFSRGNVVTNTGIGMPIFGLYLIGTLFWGIVIMLKHLRNSHGIVHIQWKIIFAGFSTMLILEVIFLFFFTMLLNDIQFLPYAPLFVLPFLAAMSYALIRYRLFSLRSLIKRGATFSITLILTLLFYTAIILGIRDGITIDINPKFESTIFVLIIVISYAFIHRLIKKLVDFTFSPPPSKLDIAFEEVMKYREKEGIDQMIKKVVNRLESEIPIRKIKTYYRTKKKKFNSAEDDDLSFSEDSTLVNYLKSQEEIIIKEELPFIIEEEGKTTKEMLREIEKVLVNHNADLAILLGSKDSFPVIIFITLNADNRLLSREQIDVVKDVLEASSLAVDNAFLYEQTLKSIGIIE